MQWKRCVVALGRAASAQFSQKILPLISFLWQVEKRLAENGDEPGAKRTWFQTHQERMQEKGLCIELKHV